MRIVKRVGFHSSGNVRLSLVHDLDRDTFIVEVRRKGPRGTWAASRRWTDTDEARAQAIYEEAESRLTDVPV